MQNQIVKALWNVINVKKEGDYHTALCNPNKVSDNPTEEEITCLVKNNTNILQQTANALVTDKNETRFRGKIIIRRRVTTDIHNSKGSRWTEIKSITWN